MGTESSSRVSWRRFSVALLFSACATFLITPQLTAQEAKHPAKSQSTLGIRVIVTPVIVSESSSKPKERFAGDVVFHFSPNYTINQEEVRCDKLKAGVCKLLPQDRALLRTLTYVPR
jgi:hypothetical protein